MEKELYINPDELRAFKIKRGIYNGFMYTFLVLMALFIIIPFYYMLTSSFKSVAEITSGELTFLPKEWHFENYTKLFNPEQSGLKMNLWWMFGNTLFVGIVTTALGVVTTVLAAFAFSRLNWKGREAVFTLLLATMMIPGEVYVLTNFITMGEMGLTSTTNHIDTYIALILPFIVGVFDIFFLRQAFRQIPNELYLAAKVDGIGDFKYLLRIMIPIAKSTLTTIIILSIIGSWNAYVWPKLITNGNHPELFLISNGLNSAFSGLTAQTGPNSVLNLQMAASTIVSLPLLVVFFSFKKYIIRGVSRSGIKG